jgi:predicted DNA-binding antitoxin AbrB/MazE fold protein
MQPIEAIYENGVFRPLVAVALPEHERVQISIVPAAPQLAVGDRDEIITAQRQALDRLDAEMANLPVENPDDGFSARDHDLVLYGWKK